MAMMTRRDFLRTNAVLAGLLGAGIPPVIAAEALKRNVFAPPILGGSGAAAANLDPTPAVVRCASAKTCRVLQFTDLHFFQKTETEDEQTRADCRRHVELQKPDLVIATGDTWYENVKSQGLEHLRTAAAFFGSLGLPWTIAWGNHDKLDNYDAGHRILHEAKGSLYRGGVTHGDYRIEVRPNGSATATLNLMVLNSNENGLGPWQVAALDRLLGEAREAAHADLPSVLFFHIPVLEYLTQITPESFHGAKYEDVGHGYEQGELCGLLQKRPSVKGSFCGHSHTNDYFLKLKGLELHHGRATGTAGYGGPVLRKGAKLIEIDTVSGKLQQRTVFADQTPAAS
jgi:hypothetical protein